MYIQIDREQLDRLCRHAETTYPEECCGIVIGKIESITDLKKIKVILDIIPTPNIWNEALAKSLAKITNLSSRKSQKEKNFFIAPEELLKAQKQAREQKAIVLGFYHSHPDAAAIPSEFDRAIAWPSYSYLILSLNQGKVENLRSWQLDETRQFQPEEIKSI
jgi:proteasome lid subunit RPN8/RPN11